MVLLNTCSGLPLGIQILVSFASRLTKLEEFDVVNFFFFFLADTKTGFLLLTIVSLFIVTVICQH